jgi:arsenate reductase
VTELVFYHNPRCSKSRQALALLEARGLEPKIVRYLETPPDAAMLERILKALGLEPRQLMRRQEAPYAAHGLDDPKLGRKALIEAMVEHPILIERPILVKGDLAKGGRAALGRPPEQVLEIL